MNTPEINILIEKYLAGKCTVEEQLQVEKWLEENSTLTNEWMQMDGAAKTEWMSSLFGEIKNTIDSREQQAAPVRTMRSKIWRNMAAAAVVLVLTGLTGYLLLNRKQDKELTGRNESHTIQNDIAPGSDKAILTLADGRNIPLDSSAKGNIAMPGAVTVINTDGVLAYDINEKPTDIVYNTLSTPKGGQYRLVLADGSKVWLNAASSLRFPTAFVGEERRVEVTGEAYFEVAHRTAMPFIVQKGDATIHVLGTDFNVNAYEDEAALKIALLEGSVKVNKASQSVLIKPGQQVEIDPTGDIKLNKDVDPDEIVAWKNGYFNFSRLQIQEIMRQVARWYDVKVEYEGRIPEKHFTGIVSRDNKISEVLKIMEHAGIRFRLEGNKIIVTQ